MTTIAWNLTRQEIAADGLVCSGNTILFRDAKKIVKANGFIFAIAGETAVFDALIEWHWGGSKADDVPTLKGKDCSWTFLVIGEQEGKLFAEVCTDEAPYFVSIPPLFALGTGCDIAIGAMRAGKSPREAVEIAMLDDVKTGGEIQVIDISEALGLKALEAAE